MQVDLFTWGIWSFGLALLTYWCVNTCREFIKLFSRHKQTKKAGALILNRDKLSHDVLQEIMSQPKIWERTLAMLQEGAVSSLSKSSGRRIAGPIVLTGCGSSYYLSAAVSPLWGGKNDAPVRAISATDLLTYPEGYLNRSAPGTLIAVSRWGKTNETCTAARHARQDLGWNTIALTCDPKSPLTEICNETISLAEAAENSPFYHASLDGDDSDS